MKEIKVLGLLKTLWSRHLSNKAFNWHTKYSTTQIYFVRARQASNVRLSPADQIVLDQATFHNLLLKNKLRLSLMIDIRNYLLLSTFANPFGVAETMVAQVDNIME